MYLLLILSLVPFINGQVARLGECKNIPAVQDFRPDDFAGTWYTIAGKSDMFDDHIKCAFAKYDYVKDGGYFNTIYSGLNVTDGERVAYDAKTEIIQPGSADFMITVKLKGGQVKFDVKIIELDYKNYAAYWGCEQRDGYCIRYLWIVGRQNNLSPELRKQVLNAYAKDDLMIDDILFADQSDCTYN